MDHMSRAERLHARGDTAGAEAAYRAAIAAGPELAVLACAHFNLGVRLEQRGDKAGAGAAYRAAIAADPELERAHSQLGNHLFERGDSAGAEAAWRAAIAADSGGACGTAPYCNLGGLLAQGGDFAGGARFFEAALKIDPSNAELQENMQNAQAALKEQRSAGAVRLGAELDHYERGRRLHDRGDKAGAEAAYRAAIAADPQDAHAHYNLGNLLEQRGDKAGAESAYRAAIAADPELAVAHNNLGKHLFERGDNAGAEAAWRAAIAADPQGAGAYSNLGCLLAQGGDLAGGARFFEAALKIDPSNAELQENTQKVQAALKEQQSAGAVRLDAEPFPGSRPYPMYRCPTCRQLGQIGDDSHSHRGVPCPPIPADAEVVMFHAGPSASGAGTRTAECNADGEIVGASGARNCSSCGERGKVKCSGCGLAYYCGAACQKAHWKAHRPACKRGQAERKEHAVRIAESFGSGGSGLAAGGSFVSHGGATIHTTQDGRVCISGTRMQAASSNHTAEHDIAALPPGDEWLADPELRALMIDPNFVSKMDELADPAKAVVHARDPVFMKNLQKMVKGGAISACHVPAADGRRVEPSAEDVLQSYNGLMSLAPETRVTVARSDMEAYTWLWASLEKAGMHKEADAMKELLRLASADEDEGADQGATGKKKKGGRKK